MQATSMMIEKADRYCKKSGDTKEEFLESNYKTFVREEDNFWLEYRICDDIFWIQTCYSEKDVVKTNRWKSAIQLAKNYGCKKIQFTTTRNNKVWERKLGVKTIAYKMEYTL